MGNGSRFPNWLAPLEPILVTICGLLIFTGASPLLADPGIVIYTTLDHGRDETAIAVPFIKAERFALVTSVTTSEGKSLRVTNNQMKELVYPPDLTSATVVDDAGIAALHAKLAEFRALQERFPRTHIQLSPIINELGRVVRLLDEGNVLVTGRFLSGADYEIEAAANRAKTVDLNVNGVVFERAKLTSVSGEKISIMHSGGVASVMVGQLSDEQIARLKGTNPNVAVVSPKPTPPVQEPDSSPAPKMNTATSVPAPVPVDARPGFGDVAKSSDHATPTLSSANDAVLENKAEEQVVSTPSSADNSVPNDTADEKTIDQAVALKLQDLDPQIAGRLVAILRSCQNDVEKIFAGHGALSDISSFPGGRFGSMDYDEAMREVNVQKGKVNDALLYQGMLLSHLRELKAEADAENGKGVSPELREWISDLANVSKTSLEDLIGLVGVSAKVSWLLNELTPLVPEAQKEITHDQPLQSSDSGSGLRRPIFNIIVVSAACALGAVLVLLVARLRNRPRRSSPDPVLDPPRYTSSRGESRGRRIRVPEWMWLSFAGLGATAIVVGVVISVDSSKQSHSDDSGLDDFSDVSPDEEFSSEGDRIGGGSLKQGTPGSISSPGAALSVRPNLAPALNGNSPAFSPRDFSDRLTTPQITDQDTYGDLERLSESERTSARMYGISEQEMLRLKKITIEKGIEAMESLAR